MSGGGLSALTSYRMDFNERGQAIIINNHHFHPSTLQGDRDGTEVDGEAIERSLRRLGFRTTVHDDLTRLSIVHELTKVAEDDHSDSDCFVCVILSHGVEGRVYGTDSSLPLTELTKLFKGDVCPTLAGKPKIFIVQACRGEKLDRGALLQLDETDSHPQTCIISAEADFLIAYSVASGYFSWRNNQDGSWYIQTLCDLLNECGERSEFVQLLTLVNNVVSTKFSSDSGDPWTAGCKQIPSILSQLTKLLYFPSKHY